MWYVAEELTERQLIIIKMIGCRTKCRSRHKISLGETECEQKNYSERYGIPAREETHTMGQSRQRWSLGNYKT